MGRFPRSAQLAASRGRRGTPVLQAHTGAITHIPERAGSKGQAGLCEAFNRVLMTFK